MKCDYLPPIKHRCDEHTVIRSLDRITCHQIFRYSIKQLGLLRKYTSDLDFKVRVKKLAALAFVPLLDIIPAYESLSTTFLPDELPIFHYFESMWIGLTVGGRRMAPAFPHVMWNVHDRYTDGASRTTNALEAFHHSFNSLISCQHPSIWTLLTSLEKQQALTTNTINEITRGTSFVHSAKERKRNERIQTLVSGYTLPQADRMLRGIAYNYM